VVRAPATAFRRGAATGAFRRGAGVGRIIVNDEPLDAATGGGGALPRPSAFWAGLRLLANADILATISGLTACPYDFPTRPFFLFEALSL
tara:strand:- start:551 stop:820 length:270 start_codon:yes stop_codon:yes gene_type:complete